MLLEIHKHVTLTNYGQFSPAGSCIGSFIKIWGTDVKFVPNCHRSRNEGDWGPRVGYKINIFIRSTAQNSAFHIRRPVATGDSADLPHLTDLVLEQ